MTHTAQTLRVRLGPLASGLIEGQVENRQQALEDAIAGLLERIENAPASSPETTELTTLAARIGDLEAAARGQADHLEALKSLMVIEQKMTRIYVASFFATDSEEQQELIAMADEAIEEHLAKTDLLTAKEREKLRREEDAIQNAILREIQRGDIEPEPRKQEQLEL